MKRTSQPISKIVIDLRELFELDKENEFSSSESDMKFLIDKRQFERMDVLSMLSKYFEDNIVHGGYVSVDNITLVFTAFEIHIGTPKFKTP